MLASRSCLMFLQTQAGCVPPSANICEKIQVPFESWPKHLPPTPCMLGRHSRQFACEKVAAASGSRSRSPSWQSSPWPPS